MLGRGGLLASALETTKAQTITLRALCHQQLDITDSQALAANINQFSPDIIINAAGFTQVEAAEKKPKLAFAVNGDAVEHLAKLALEHRIKLIHVSTDYVFDGAQVRPYACNSLPRPLNQYAASKRAGEIGLLKYAVQAPKGLLSFVRTSWLYGDGQGNFVDTMLRLMQTKEELNVVRDQYGSPSYVIDLACFIWQLSAEKPLLPIYHWADSGQCSWYEFAVEIQSQALHLGLITRAIPIKPITSEQYPSILKRPKYSVLDTSASHALRQPKPWQQQLNVYLKWRLAHSPSRA